MICLTGDVHHMSLKTRDQAHLSGTEMEAALIYMKIARKYGCIAHPGGEGPNQGWYVYYFRYTRER